MTLCRLFCTPAVSSAIRLQLVEGTGLIEGLELQRIVKGWVLVSHQVCVIVLPACRRAPAPSAETRGQQHGADEQQAAGRTQPREDEHEAGLGGEGSARPPRARGLRLAQAGSVGR